MFHSYVILPEGISDIPIYPMFAASIILNQLFDHNEIRQKMHAWNTMTWAGGYLSYSCNMIYVSVDIYK